MTVYDKEAELLIKEYQWHKDKEGYLIGRKTVNGKRQKVRMHRLVLGITDPKVIVDHINRQVDDNRKENLRVVTHQQNCLNSKRPSSTGYKGVQYAKGKYRALIRKGDKVVHIGTYLTVEEAARAFDVEAKKLHGNFALLNGV